MKSPKKFLLLTVFIAMLPLAALPTTRWWNEEFSRIPSKHMWVWCRDIKAKSVASWRPAGAYGADVVGKSIAPWGQKGTATLLSKDFQVSFEGYSFSPDGLIGGDYQIDGRYGGLLSRIFGPDSSTFPVEENNGVKFEYLARTRTLAMTFKNYRVDYCQARQTVATQGKEYSTANGPIALWIRKNGEVARL